MGIPEISEHWKQALAWANEIIEAEKSSGQVTPELRPLPLFGRPAAKDIEPFSLEDRWNQYRLERMTGNHILTDDITF